MIRKKRIINPKRDRVVDLNNSAKSSKLSPRRDKSGVDMRGIYPNGRCPTCKGPFKFDKKRGIYKCLKHNTKPGNYTVAVHFKGEMIRRSRHLEGRSLTTVNDAVALKNQADADIKKGKFRPELWRSTSQNIYHPMRLILKWYWEKLHALRNGDLKPSYIRSLRGYIRNYFIPFGTEHNLQNIRDIVTTKDFFESLDRLAPKKKQLSPKYRKNIRLAVATFFHWVQNEERLIDAMPFIPSITVPKKAPEVLPMEVRQSIVDNFVLPRHRPIFGYYINQGPRPGELIALIWEDIKEDPAHGKYVIYQRNMSDDVLVNSTKDDEPRFNPIFRETEKYLPPRGLAQSWVFTNMDKQYTTSVLRHQLYWAFKRYNKHMADEAEKQGKTWEPVKIPLYNFGKHSRSSEFYEEGYSLVDIQHYHGHSKPETSLIYTKIDVLKRFRSKPIDFPKKKAENE